MNLMGKNAGNSIAKEPPLNAEGPRFGLWQLWIRLDAGHNFDPSPQRVRTQPGSAVLT